jgi:outer membrane protein assembly complex protein YaeT
MRRLVRVALALAACLLAAGRAGADVADYIGRPVGSVRLLTEGRDTTDPVLMQVVETLVGQPLSIAQVRESIAHLFSLRRFEDVRVDATLEDGKVALRYDLVPIHPVARIRFEGDVVNAPGVDVGVLRQAILDRYGTSPPLGRLAEMTRIIDDGLRERGYLHSTIVPHPEVEHAPERATLVFAIELGPRTTIGTVTVVGRPSVPEAEFLSRLGLKAGAPYQRDALNTRIDRYVEERRKRGYYEAQVTPVVQFDAGDRVANVTLNVASGPHVRIVFAGDPLPTDKREDLVPVEREGSVDEDLLEDSSNRIEEALRALGYRDAAAPHTRESIDDELVITFTVKRGQPYRVASVTVSGNTSVPSSDFEPALRSRAGQPFSEAALDADLTTIQELYRRRGFVSVKAVPTVDFQKTAVSGAAVPVPIGIAITEGARALVESVSFSGEHALSDAALQAVLRLRPGAPFVPGLVAVDRDALEIKYQDLGYENVSVEPATTFSQNSTRVAIEYTINEGRQIFIDHVLIVGNVRTATSTIEHELRVKAGDPMNLGAIAESQQRLVALGLFRRAQISEVRRGDETHRDLVVTIDEAPPTTIDYGAGAEGKLHRVVAPDGVGADAFLLAPSGSFDITRRNLFGKNRSVSLFMSVAANRIGLQPGTDIDSSSNVTEYRVVGTYREPRLFNTSFDAFVNLVAEQQIRSTFDFTRRTLAGTIARRFPHGYTVTGSYQLQWTRVFNLDVSPGDQLLIDRLFPQSLLSSFTVAASRDKRNDPVDPTNGTVVGITTQLAAKAIGSDVGFVKSYFTAQAFHPVPGAPGLVLAGNAALGVARGFGTDAQLLASERFFAGGDTTNRGFALDQLGIRGETIDQNGSAIGGNGVMLLMGELRAHVIGGLGVAGFVDTGNVFALVSDINPSEFRTSIGGGIRYKSPIGPLRVDLGFKVHPQPGESATAWFVSFGQAF